jgi:hypothetical protein
MAGRSLQSLMVIGFAVAVGHLAWHALVGPPLPPTYFVGGDVTALHGADPEQKQLYLRRTLYLSQRPRQGWLQVLSRDHVRLYVNDQLVQDIEQDGFPVAILADLAPYLQVGRNVIAIVARQTSPRHSPLVAVDGAYELSDGEHRLQSDEKWRYRTIFERKAFWWFQNEFDDNHWPHPAQKACRLSAAVPMPPRSITAPGSGVWITPPVGENRTTTVRREFQVPGPPRQAWLRVTADAAYRLAMNGVVLDEQEVSIVSTTPVPLLQRRYDITPLIQSGRNLLAFALTSSSGAPHLLADLEVEDIWGRHVSVGSDSHWLCRPGLSEDGLQLHLANPLAWQPCPAETGDLNMPPWLATRQDLALVLPWHVQMARVAGQIGLMALIGLLTALACRWAGRRLVQGRPSWRARAAEAAIVLTLVPATVAIAVGVLATYDPRIGTQHVYRALWVFCALLSLPLQWHLLTWLRQWRLRWHIVSNPEWASLVRSSATPAVIALLVVIGLWFRVKDIAVEPLHWDEITAYRYAVGGLVRGFPNQDLGDTMPVVYINTSELAYTYLSMTALIFRDPLYAIRIPAILWSTATIVLIYWIGRGFFRSRAVGLVAATIYTFSPVCIAMSNFGRYFGSLQFFTLLCIYLYWQTIRGTGRIDRRALWLCTVTFAPVFLSWEGGALIAVGMVLALLLLRRGHLAPVFSDASVWGALVAAGCVVLLQLSHRQLQQTQSLWYGISASDASIMPMWPYAIFQPLYYVWNSSWSEDTLLPMVGLLGSMLLAAAGPWRRPIRFLLLIYLATSFISAALLSLIAWRYIHHLTPVLILLASASLVSLAQGLFRAIQRVRASRPWQPYARFVAGSVVAVLLVVGSGMTLQLVNLTSFHVQLFGPNRFKFINLGATAMYLRGRITDDDIVLCSAPYVADHYLGCERRAYWVHSTLHLPAAPDDRSLLVLDRRNGSTMIADLGTLQNLFAQNRRIWFAVDPAGTNAGNDPEVTAFLRQNMDVVYEDFQAMVMLRDGNHRPMVLQQANQKALGASSTTLLP